MKEFERINKEMQSKLDSINQELSKQYRALGISDSIELSGEVIQNSASALRDRIDSLTAKPSVFRVEDVIIETE